MSFSLISCENGVTTSEFDPLLDDPLLEGFWRIEGDIDAPLDWDPTEDSDLFQIWFGATEPVWSLSEVESSITYSLVFTGLDAWRWHFKTTGPYTYEPDTWNSYFCPPANWWSHPDSRTAVFRRTWVQGYMWVEFGGGWALVLADEDWSFNPKNYADGWPRPDWKYYQPYPYPNTFYWVWDTVYLDLT